MTACRAAAASGVTFYDASNKAGHAYKATPKKNSFNLWEIRNGGGGWVHPFHPHMEEHRTVMRNNRTSP